MSTHAMKSATLAGGFAEPVFEAQSVFRAVMDAMARPGKIVDILEKAAPPAPLSPESGALALCLFDHETPVWLDAALAGAPDVADWLRFHTGAPVVSEPNEAAFALVSDPSRMPVLAAFRPGTSEYPDRSTTLIVAIETLDGPALFTLSGPGIKDTEHLSPHPLPVGFADQATANHALFPRGVDIIFTAAGKLAALPRSTRITTQGA
jgi:alpha-D-ribose 1-methylphosphonate 5-triphosphate synthase subunit PhnH